MSTEGGGGGVLLGWDVQHQVGLLVGDRRRGWMVNRSLAYVSWSVNLGEIYWGRGRATLPSGDVLSILSVPSTHPSIHLSNHPIPSIQPMFTKSVLWLHY